MNNTPIILENSELGSLKQIADMLWEEINKEIEKNGCSDLTLRMESAVRGIHDIITLNDIKE